MTTLTVARPMPASIDHDAFAPPKPDKAQVALAAADRSAEQAARARRLGLTVYAAALDRRADRFWQIGMRAHHQADELHGKA